MPKSLGYLGPEGTFTHHATLSYAQSQPNDALCLQPFGTISGVLTAVARGDADLGLVPAENSVEGSVNVTLDTLAREHALFIQGELVLDIKHHLMTYATSLKDITTILGHPQALAQCRGFLEQNLSQAKIKEASSSAEAVSRLSSQENLGWAAIGTPYCQTFYPTPILVENIGDYAHNQTRFLLVGREPISSGVTTKTSLILALHQNNPGSLYEVLGTFAQKKINLSKIESRPSKNVLGHYLFFIDCEAGLDHNNLAQVLEELKTKTIYLKNLGSYAQLIS